MPHQTELAGRYSLIPAWLCNGFRGTFVLSPASAQPSFCQVNVTWFILRASTQIR